MESNSVARNTDDIVGQRLSVARERRGWSMRELAAQADVDPSVISNIEAGHTLSPRIGTLDKIAAALGIPVESLVTRSPRAPRADILGGVARIPIVRYKAHAGDETIWDDLGGADLLPAELARGKRLLAARVVGDCMEPEVSAGDTVIWDQVRREPGDGELVVVTEPGRGLLVKYVVRGEHGLQLYSIRDGYEPLNDTIHLEGVVVRVSKTPRRIQPPAG
jgi:transcriptional regulator with XRE-family HTH domain